MATQKNRRYKSYLRNPELDVPKTTAWNWRDKRKAILKCEGTDVTIRSKRRAYNINPSMPVPRQTKWFWKTKKGTNDTMHLSGFIIICSHV